MPSVFVRQSIRARGGCDLMCWLCCRIEESVAVFVEWLFGLARIAHGEDFPLMAFGFVPVNLLAVVTGVDLPVNRAVHRAAIGDAGRPEAREDLIERCFSNSEAEVFDGKRLVGLDEIEC